MFSSLTMLGIGTLLGYILILPARFRGLRRILIYKNNYQ